MCNLRWISWCSGHSIPLSVLVEVTEDDEETCFSSMVFSTYTMTFVLIPRKGKSKRSAEVAMQSLFEAS